MSRRRIRAWVIGAANFGLLIAIALVSYHIPFGGARGFDDRFRTDNEFIRGDSNDDGFVDISDPLHILGFLFGGGEIPPCRAASDANDSARIDISDALLLLNFLFGDGFPPSAPYPEPDRDPTFDLGCREAPAPPVPAVGELGGPDRELTDAEMQSWLRGRQLFDRRTTLAEGLGPMFNGDSCRGCHLDPVIGGSGGLDVNVVRFANEDPESGEVTFVEGGPATSRFALLTLQREEIPPDGNIIESRQTPTVLGLGLVDRLSDDVLLANADPDDSDGDGISGRAKIVNGRVARFGHKCDVPTLLDFTADALFNELGVTVGAHRSTFAVAEDTDGAEDPELSDEQLDDLAFFSSHLAPPPRLLPDSPNALALIAEGESLFAEIGCAKCHVPALEGADGPVPAYSDFLLHDVADPRRYQVMSTDAEPREFRTAPLWGVRDTGPYLHDGSAESLRNAILIGHWGEAEAARDAYEALPIVEAQKLEAFLLSL